MAKDTNQADSFDNGNTGGLLTGFLAEEGDFDRHALWRLGSWAAASVGAVIVALLASQSSTGWRREQVATADLVRQSQQIQALSKESQNETRRLASAIDTLNGDRDRLYARVTVLEQGLDAATSSIAIVRQNPAPASTRAAASPPPAAKVSAAAQAQAAAQNPVPPPVVAPVVTTMAAIPEKPQAAAEVAGPSRGPSPDPSPGASFGASPSPGLNPGPSPAPVASAGPATSTPPAVTTPAATATAPPMPAPLMASKSMMAPPDAAAAKLVEPEKPVSAVTAAAPDMAAPAPSADSAAPEASQAAAPAIAVQRTEFAVDVGTANSVGGLRALWRGLVKSNTVLAALRPIIVVKESSTGFGMQLRLAAGPLGDTAAAAKICAALTESQRPCETTVFDGQRLAMNPNEPPAADKPPAFPKPAPASVKQYTHKRVLPKHETTDEPAKKPEVSTLSAWFGRH